MYLLWLETDYVKKRNTVMSWGIGKTKFCIKKNENKE